MNSQNRVIRVLTWNIHKGLGLDGRRDLDRIVARISRHEPDVIALQEVDSRRRGVSPFEVLREGLGEHCAEAHTITAPDGHYGHMIISRWPISQLVMHDLSVGRREPRSAIEAIVESEHGPLHLVAVHLGLGFGERRRQVRMLSDTAAAAAGMPSVLMGDFNDWLWRGAVNAALLATHHGRTWHRTFPSFLPMIRLDRIYCRPKQALVRSWSDRKAWVESDHLPVIAEIALPS